MHQPADQEHPRDTAPSHVAIVDATVLLTDPYALNSLPEKEIIVPLAVLQELEQLCSERGTTGRHSRQALQFFEPFRAGGTIFTGTSLPDSSYNSTVRVCDTQSSSLFSYAQSIHCAEKPVTIYSQRITTRLRATQLGITARHYEHTTRQTEHTIPQVYTQALQAKELKTLTNSRVSTVIDTNKLYINQFVRLESQSNSEQYRLFRYHGGVTFSECSSKPLFTLFTAHNSEQQMALDALLDDEIKLVSLIGLAGSGKTFLTLVAALSKMLIERQYARLMVTRPTVALGPDIGFLPGDMTEKLDSWMQPIYDNINMITSTMRHKKIPMKITLEELLKNNQLSLQAVTYMRGRSLPKQFLFVDEAQNLTPLEVKTLVTRAGVGTKVVLSGDPDQIDNTKLSKYTNGLSVTTGRFLGDKLFCAVTLHHSERSALAQRAADLL